MRDIVLPFVCLPAPGGGSPQLGRVYVTPTFISTEIIFPHPPSHYHLALELISARGWCMQEYLMSPRALLFASHTLQLKCLTMTQNVGGALHRPFNKPSLTATLLLSSPPHLAPRSKRWHRLHAAWWTVVVDYIKRSITSPADKLVACGAVAAEFGRVLSTEYLAGLWRDTLLHDMMWFKRPASANVARPAAYRAPSWSWAAVDGEVSHHEGFSDATVAAVAEVVKREVVLKDAALLFGEMTGGSLVLRAALVPCKWGQDRPYDGLRFIAHQHGEDPPERLDEESVRQREAKSGFFAQGYIDSEPDDAGIRGLWAVPLFRNGPYYMDGLIVSRTVSLDGSGLPHARKLSYRRVGIFRMMEPVVQALGLDGDLQVAEIELV